MLCTRFSIAAASMLLATAAALAEPGEAPNVEIERMTWVEVRDRLAHGAATVIIPTGGTECNGPHMVTGKHNFIVAEAARRIARELGNALVAPVIAYVPEGDIEAHTGHMAYPGTFSVPDHVFSALLEAAAASAHAHGFTTIVFLGDSGGNQAPQEEVAQNLNAKWEGESVVVINAAAYYAGNGGEEWLRAQGESDASIGTHAGIRDTSELMSVYPEGVHLERAKAGVDGSSGEPARASAERGRHLLDLKVQAAIAEIRAAQQRGQAQAAAPSLFAWLYRLIFG